MRFLTSLILTMMDALILLVSLLSLILTMMDALILLVSLLSLILTDGRFGIVDKLIIVPQSRDTQSLARYSP